MASYQFIIELIPEKWVSLNKNSAINLLFRDHEYDTSICWKNCEFNNELEKILSDILPRSKSWHKDLFVWGDDKYSDIQVWLENNNIDSIKFRLDLRKSNESLIIKIVNLAKKLDCCFLLPESRKILNPDINDLNEVISSSIASDFVNEPDRFFND